jgi:glutathione S-transferase
MTFPDFVLQQRSIDVKLYYAPGACSLATHIALLDTGLDFDLERVDLKQKITASGADFTAINAKGYVPALVLDSGELITENLAVLDWITIRFPALGIEGKLGRTRLLEALAYIATEIHKGFKPFWHGTNAEEKSAAEILLIKRFHWFAERMQGRYLFGDLPTVADYYLLVTLRWAERFGIAIPEPLIAFKARLLARPNVQAAIAFEEGAALKAGVA